MKSLTAQKLIGVRIANEILMYLRARKKGGKEISLYEPIGTDRDGNEIRLYDIIETTDTDVPEKLYLKENIQKLYEKVESELSPRERLVLKMRYGLYNGEEYTQREIASLLGISRSYVSRIEKKAVGILRGCFADECCRKTQGLVLLTRRNCLRRFPAAT